MSRQAIRTRQRQVLDTLYRLGEGSVADVRREMPEDLSYSAVRSVLRELEEKDLVKHREKELRYLYSPVVARSRASRAALSHMLKTFFDDDPAHAMKALLDVTKHRKNVDFAELKRLVERARREGR